MTNDEELDLDEELKRLISEDNDEDDGEDFLYDDDVAAMMDWD